MLAEHQLKNYSNMSIRKLSHEIKKNGFIYRLVKRTENKLLYSQENGVGIIQSYEVFTNKLGNLHRAKERWCKLQKKEFKPQDYEEWYEVFPKDEEFGKRAWSYPKLDQALGAFETK